MAQGGTVKFFNGERGYGFIKPDDGGRDVFVHITAVERAGLKSLNEGQRINFDVEPDKKGKGPKAVNLVITGSLIMIIPIVAAFLLLQRYWRAGLSAGAVKQ